MKKLTLIIALGLSLVTVSAFGYEYRSENRYAYVSRGETADWIGASNV